MTALHCYILGALATASLLMAWFRSGLPYHVADILYLVTGSEKPQDAADAVFKSSRDDWENMMNAKAMEKGWFASLVMELLCCRTCLSFHIALWVSVAIYVLVVSGATSAPEGAVDWTIIPAGALTWPVLANLIMKGLGK